MSIHSHDNPPVLPEVPESMQGYTDEEKRTAREVQQAAQEKRNQDAIVEATKVAAIEKADKKRKRNLAIIGASAVASVVMGIGSAVFIGGNGDSTEPRQEPSSSAPDKTEPSSNENPNQTEVSSGGYKLTAEQQSIYQSGDQEAINAEDDKSYRLVLGEVLQSIYTERVDGTSADDAISKVTSSEEVAQSLRTEVGKIAEPTDSNPNNYGLALCPIIPDLENDSASCRGRSTSAFIEGAPVVVKADLATMDDLESLNEENRYELNFSNQITRQLSADGSHLELVPLQQ